MKIVTAEYLWDKARKSVGLDGEIVSIALLDVGAGLLERLDESNRLAEAHTDLLRQVGAAAVIREAEAIERDTDRLKLITTDRDAVLDEVQEAVMDMPWQELGVDPGGAIRKAIERLRTADSQDGEV